MDFSARRAPSLMRKATCRRALLGNGVPFWARWVLLLHEHLLAVDYVYTALGFLQSLSSEVVDGGIVLCPLPIVNCLNAILNRIEEELDT